MPQFAICIDRTGSFGIGGGAGIAYPLAPSQFSDSAAAKLSWDLWARFHNNQLWMIEASYHRAIFPGPEAIIAGPFLSMGYSIFKDENFSPIFIIGAGAVSIHNLQKKNSPYWAAAIKTGVGIEWDIHQQMDLGARVEYRHALDLGAEAESEVATIAPMVSVTFHFDTGAGIEIKDSKSQAQAKPEASKEAGGR